MSDQDNTTQPELLPCPFCGGEAKLLHNSGSYGYTPPSITVSCAPCKISYSADTSQWEKGKGHYGVYDEAKAEVMAWWNRRA